MAESHKKTAREPAVKADAAPVKADAGTIRQALDELGINKPFYTCKVVGNRLEFTLYGGDVVTWPPENVGADGRPPKRRKS